MSYMWLSLNAVRSGHCLSEGTAVNVLIKLSAVVSTSVFTQCIHDDVLNSIVINLMI